MMAAGGILTGTLVGCSTVDPLQVEQTSRDLKTYEEKNVEPLPVARYKIAVICKSSVHAVNRSLFDTLPHVCSAKVPVEGNFQYFRYILIDFVDECLK